jgi:hypothetical protein
MSPQGSHQTALEPLRASSSRKRKETSRVTENADPLLLKNKKSKPTTHLKPKQTLQTRKRLGPQASTPHTETSSIQQPSSTQQPSVEVEDVEDEDNVVPHAQPKNPNHIIEAADGSDDDPEDEAPDIIEVDDDSEEPEEPEEDELSE